MPNLKNNQGFGYLPILAISALVLTGSYFGYSWYSSNSIKESDVLAVGTPNKPTTTTPAFNINNKPVVFKTYNDKNQSNVSIVWHLIGRDLGKIENLVNSIKNNKIIFFGIPPRITPCTSLGVPYASSILEPSVLKVAPDYYIVSAKVNITDLDKRNTLCGGVKNYYTFFPGLDDNYIFVNKTDKVFKDPIFRDPVQYWISIQNSGLSGTSSNTETKKNINVPSELTNGFIQANN